jgi:3',5'-cyclic AMP phosphodiesterase CpdA
MRILLISDLHIGQSARCKSMIPEAERQHATNTDDFGIRSQLRRFFENSQDAAIDYIIVGGDISDRASYEQFEHFDLFAGEACHFMGVSPDRILFTPGNHDVSWSVLSAGNSDVPSAARIDARYDPIRKSESLERALKSASPNGNLYRPPFFQSWDFEELFALSINTAAHDDPEVVNHPGSISDETLAAVQKQVNQLDLRSTNKPKVLIIHHHPIQYPTLIDKWRDYSVLQSNADVVEKAAEWGFDIIVHGHRHTPSFRSVLPQNGHQVSVIACGSFSQKFPPFVYEKINNQFHIIEIEQRDQPTQVLCGTVSNYAFSSFDGWVPSSAKSDGIEPKIRFGPNQHRPALKAAISKLLVAEVSTNGQFTLAEIRSRLSELEYVSDSLVEAIVNEVVSENTFRRFGERLDHAIILKGV